MVDNTDTKTYFDQSGTKRELDSILKGYYDHSDLEASESLETAEAKEKAALQKIEEAKTDSISAGDVGILNATGDTGDKSGSRENIFGRNKEGENVDLSGIRNEGEGVDLSGIRDKGEDDTRGVRK